MKRSTYSSVEVVITVAGKLTKRALALGNNQEVSLFQLGLTRGVITCNSSAGVETVAAVNHSRVVLYTRLFVLLKDDDDGGDNDNGFVLQ